MSQIDFAVKRKFKCREGSVFEVEANCLKLSKIL